MRLYVVPAGTLRIDKGASREALACRGVRRILVCGVCARIPAHTVARVAEHALADAPWIVPHAAAVQFARAHADV